MTHPRAELATSGCRPTVEPDITNPDITNATSQTRHHIRVATATNVYACQTFWWTRQT
jgi:hypothetical protein